MTQQPAVVATTGVVAVATAEVDGPPSGGFSDGAYYSGFVKQRPLQEIVLSLQGSYNFLQESQIDLEGTGEEIWDLAFVDMHCLVFK